MTIRLKSRNSELIFKFWHWDENCTNIEIESWPALHFGIGLPVWDSSRSHPGGSGPKVWICWWFGFEMIGCWRLPVWFDEDPVKLATWTIWIFTWTGFFQKPWHKKYKQVPAIQHSNANLVVLIIFSLNMIFDSLVLNICNLPTPLNDLYFHFMFSENMYFSFCSINLPNYNILNIFCFPKNILYVAAIICTIAALISLIFCHNGGNYVFTIFDNFRWGL